MRKIQNQCGYTIIELMIVIVVISIIAVMAVPTIISLTSEAKQNTTNSIAGALTSASATNYALSRSGSPAAVSVANCTDIANALPPSHPLPAGYTITSLAIGSGDSATCTLTNPDGDATATFIGRGT